MTPAALQTLLQRPYDRDTWTALLREVLPSVEIFARPQPIAYDSTEVTAAAQLARVQLSDGRGLAVIEVQVTGQVDLLHNRAGLRALVAQFIDQQNAHAILGLFRGSGRDYRCSFVARTSEIGPDGQLSRSETAPRRYTYLLGPGQACRTPAQRFLFLRDRSGSPAGVSLQDLTATFAVEPLYKEFFKRYGEVFDSVRAAIRPSLPDEETLKLFTQRLFNRLMFIAFIERKGWLTFAERNDYLAALWDDYVRTRTPKSNFYRERLVHLFFAALNNRGEQNIIGINRGGFLATLVGKVPYLNGGLFEKADDGSDDLPDLVVPDTAVESILHGLFTDYNFTVSEATPLEIDVAVDPEMLGKVFEELVTGRHEQGSYYTPKPIVSFMCREAIVEHLASVRPAEPRAALEKFVHDHDPAGLRDAEGVLVALKALRACDPACGSGAYLLGLLHELLDLRTCLFQQRKLDGVTAHERKLEIIEGNLYGVDLDPFAVNIARLRLWLSLAVEFEGDAPPPLPNLDFKIERGDALSAPAPATILNETVALRDQVISEFQKKKAAYLRAHGEEKKKLRTEIETLRADLRTWLHSDAPENAFDWAVEFAEVFLPTPAQSSLSGGLNLGDELAPAAAPGGFDIIVANPPYVRMELIKPQKPVLRRRFPHVHAERADLYIYFYARAHELLRQNGIAAFISSNKWIKAGYGESLCQHLLDSHAFRLVMDYGELPVFESAATDVAIFLWQKQPRAGTATRWAVVKDLDRCYSEGVRRHFETLSIDVPSTQFGKGKPRLATLATASLCSQMERRGQRLGELFPGMVCWGIKTGLNEAFFIDQTTRDRLIKETPAAVEIIKPLLTGDDVRRYEVHYRSTFLIYTQHGVDIRLYPSVEKHLRPFRDLPPDKDRKPRGLNHRATEQEWYELQQPSPKLVPILEQPKLLYPIIGKECRFVIEEASRFINDKVFVLPTADYFLLGVLNSSAVFSFLKEKCVAHGDKDEGGRLEFRALYLETLPIPNASASEKQDISKLAQRTQNSHRKRRDRVELFLREIGRDPAQGNSRNPLEMPWTIDAAEFGKRAKRKPISLFRDARDETAALTEEITKLETEIDARVAALYGL